MKPSCATKNQSVPRVPTAQKMMEIPQVKCVAKTVVPVMMQRKALTINHQFEARAIH